MRKDTINRIPVSFYRILHSRKDVIYSEDVYNCADFERAPCAIDHFVSGPDTIPRIDAQVLGYGSPNQLCLLISV